MTIDGPLMPHKRVAEMSDVRLHLLASGYVGHPDGPAVLAPAPPHSGRHFHGQNALPARGAEVAVSVMDGDFLAFNDGRDGAAIG